MSALPFADIPDPLPELPDLKGSEPQRIWANQVRPKKLCHARDELRRMELLLAQKEQRRQATGGGLQGGLEIEHLRARIAVARERLAEMERETSAHWWISHKDAAAAELLGLESGHAR